MRVFVTGATGFIGSAIVQELIGAGHAVLGLTRSEEGGKSLLAAGAAVHHGTIEDLESLRSGAAMCDGVIHTAFIHDFSKFKENCEKDKLAIEAMGAVLAGTGKPLIVTSGTGFGMAQPGSLAIEDYMPPAGTATHPRIASEEAADTAAAKGVQVSVMRLPPSVHGDGDHGFVPALIAIARDKGVSAYIGDGMNRWPAVHRLDAAKAYRLVLEQGAAAPRYNAVGEEGMPCRDIAEVIGRHLNLPVVSKSAEDAAAHFGFLGGFFAADVPASSQLTRERLGWQPTHVGLIADMEHGTYFK
jgi:nucleoside-diphosphate-sugar epimerase